MIGVGQAFPAFELEGVDEDETISLEEADQEVDVIESEVDSLSIEDE